MHVPDGFLDGSTALAAAVASSGGLAVATRRARLQLGDRQLPLAGMTAAYVFAAQMVNFPVAAGTSGHLLGGALAAVLVGPWVAALCMTVVLAVQALVFADGGLSALGVNVLLLGFVSVFTGWSVVTLCRRVVRRPSALPIVAGAAGWVSVVSSSLAFVGLYALGGAGDVSLRSVGAAMVGVHALIGAGEAVLTAATVAAILPVRPDLLHALQVPGTAPGTSRPLTRAFVAGAVGVIAAVALALSPHASSEPDGLERVAEDEGFAASATEHALGDGPLAGYAVPGVDGGLSTGVAGVVGAGATVAVAAAALALAGRRSGSGAAPPAAHVAIVGTLTFVVAVVATPREAVAAFAAHLALLLTAAALRGVRFGRLLRRLVVTVPFLLFAAALPFLGGGERETVTGLALSVEGCWAAWNIAAKASLGAMAASLLVDVYPVADLLAGLQRLRVPRPFVAIASFTVRYLDVLTSQLQRLSIARTSRGHDPRWFWQARAVGTTAGTMFVRSYERGERVHAAMLARGYDPGSPAVELRPSRRRAGWFGGLLPGLAAAAVAVTALAWS